MYSPTENKVYRRGSNFISYLYETEEQANRAKDMFLDIYEKKGIACVFDIHETRKRKFWVLKISWE